jgi:hypothetical protein
MNPWSLLDANCQMKRSHPKAHPVTMAVAMALCLLMHTGANERLLHTGIHQAQHPLCSGHCRPTGTHLLQSAVQLAVHPLVPQALHPHKTTNLTFCPRLPVLLASWRLNETCLRYAPTWIQVSGNDHNLSHKEINQFHLFYMNVKL